MTFVEKPRGADKNEILVFIIEFIQNLVLEDQVD